MCAVDIWVYLGYINCGPEGHESISENTSTFQKILKHFTKQNNISQNKITLFFLKCFRFDLQGHPHCRLCEVPAILSVSNENTISKHSKAMNRACSAKEKQPGVIFCSFDSSSLSEMAPALH